MLLLENDFLKIDYSAVTEVLDVTYGNMYALPLNVIKEQMEVIFQLVNSLGITKILFDSTKTVSSPTQETGSQIAGFIYNELKKTRLQRVARIQSPAYLTEAKVRLNMDRVQEEEKPTFLVENFATREEALEWLTAWANMQLT